jgi:exodeoxyribonuclease VII large subunit
LKILHEPLKSGIKILFSAKISYNPVYGLSLRILEIDPSWSLGELEKEKQQTLEKIKKEGLFHRNKSLIPALLPQRIAIVSVQTSKGYADFCKMIDENEWGYSFFYMLFPALLQGENAIGSIINQLENIKKVKHHFDAVAIIRGGGGDIGLTCYNSFELSRTIALFPLPVITGIGHSTNETVAEMVAFKNAITPTELADYLIQKFHNFAVPVNKALDTITAKFTRLLQDEKKRILNTMRFFRSVTLSRLAQSRNELRQEVRALQQQSSYFVKRKKAQDLTENIFNGAIAFINVQMKDVTNAERTVELLNPLNLLKRGYSLTLADGKVLKTVSEVDEGTILTTILADGRIVSTAKSVNKSEIND